MVAALIFVIIHIVPFSTVTILQVYGVLSSISSHLDIVA